MRLGQKRNTKLEHKNRKKVAPMQDPETTIDPKKLKRFHEIQKKMEARVVSGKSEHIPDCEIRYDKELNPNQFVAATTISGPLLIIAGAGSGKTRTLTYRCSFFLENGISPESILLLTFTRKAANEMVGRVQNLIGGKYRASKIHGSTFHGFANTVLRKYGNLIGLNTKFQIMDATDATDAIEMCARELDLRQKGSDFPPKSKVQSIFSMAKNWDKSIHKALFEYSEELYYNYHAEFEKLSEKYEQYKLKNSVFDFDDLMLFLRQGLKTNQQFFDRVTEKFKYIMVDEFQDTNVVQNEIVNLLASLHHNLMAVGDDSQSIYAFRGANVENIFNFVEKYPDTKIVKIEQNYRSTSAILDFANGVTDNAKMGFKKSLFSENFSDKKPFFVKCINVETEAQMIGANVQDLIGRKVKPCEIAILTRSSFHTTAIQLELLRRNIDFVLMGGLRFIERKYVKDVLAFLRIINNPFDHVAWHRVLELLPRVGKATASKIVKQIVAQEGRVDFSTFAKNKNYETLTMIEDVLKPNQEKTIPEIIESIIEKYEYLYNLKKDNDGFDKKRFELQALIKMATKYNSINKFLNDLTLDPPDSKNSSGEIGEDKNANKVVISTVHSSKGLEFEHVFMPHLLDGLFPSAKAMGSDEAVEEERRVFYVAATRAKRNLVLSHPMAFHTQNNVFQTPSQFVTEQEDFYEEKFGG